MWRLVLWGVVGGLPPPDPLGPRRSDSDGVSAETLSRPLLRTLGIVPISFADPDLSDPSTSPTSHTPPPTS